MTTPTSPNKIRVCFVFDFWRGRAGAELQLSLLLQHTDRNKIEPFVLTLHGDEQSILELPDCPVYCLNMGRLRSLSTLSKAEELRRFFKKNNIDIIQALTIDNPLLIFIATVGKWSGVKKIFGFRVDIGFWMTSGQARAGKLAHRFLVDKVIANAEACKKSIIEQENARPENIVVIPNLIETERFANIPTWTKANAHHPRRVGIVGNLKHVKGTDVFIHAAKIVLETYPDVQFELAGIGSEKDIQQYQSQIDQLDIAQNIRLLGSVSDIPAFLSTLDIATLSSRSEGLPNAIMEYMAAGRPCVVTDVGGCGELIRHNHNGLLVPSENHSALANRIIDLLNHPDRAEQFATAARKDISDQYEARIVANRWHEIYENTLCSSANIARPE
jgi:glycosyltransferase involved in cell wall biosynthesis